MNEEETPADMDEEMGDAFEGGHFLSPEVDLDYEFDASRYFDLSRMESASEAREAERWFETARSCPPSPFMAKICIGKDIIAENVNTLPKYKDTDNGGCVDAHSAVDTDPKFSELGANDNCDTMYSNINMSHNLPKPETKFISKGPFTIGSTLMKPTASQLAKQRQAIGVTVNSHFLHRYQKPQVQKYNCGYDYPLQNKTQAAKRQKLEGGQCFKVQVLDVKQQPHLVHKVPQKKEALADGRSEPSRLKLTIPREFQLVTARRAQRIRPGNSNGSHESSAPTTFVFKAHPINRRILEAPSLPLPQKSTPCLPEFHEFHLRTLERATQHKPSASSFLAIDNTPSSTLQCIAVGSRRLQHQANEVCQVQKLCSKNEPMRNECVNTLPQFKARPLNKKILSGKGDIGVFQSQKYESTRTMDFNFATDKRCHHDPPVELFNKLSLTSEARTESQTKHPRPVRAPSTKGSKENIANSKKQEVMYTCVRAEEQQCPRTTLTTFEKRGVVTDWRSRPNMSRSLGIR